MLNILTIIRPLHDVNQPAAGGVRRVGLCEGEPRPVVHRESADRPADALQRHQQRHATRLRPQHGLRPDGLSASLRRRDELHGEVSVVRLP